MYSYSMHHGITVKQMLSSSAFLPIFSIRTISQEDSIQIQRNLPTSCLCDFVRALLLDRFPIAPSFFFSSCLLSLLP